MNDQPPLPLDATPSALAPDARRRRQRRSIIALLAFALLMAWRPCNVPALFQAIPEDAFLATRHRNVSSEWHALARHPMLLNALRAAGVPDVDTLADETGFQQTLFWLTGPKTVLGLSSADGSPPLSLVATALNDPDEALRQLRLSGASYVGWKRRPMELLWHIRYVPGLGRLFVTDLGTRYLVFRHSKTMKRLGLVLSLDMYRGNLLAVLSTDPNAVTGLVARLESDAPLAPVFTANPWQSPDPDARHAIYVRPSTLGDLPPPLDAFRLTQDDTAPPDDPLRIDLHTFRNKSSLSLLATLPHAIASPAAPLPAIGPLPNNAELARLTLCGEALRAFPGLATPPAPGTLSSPPPLGVVLSLYGSPFPSTFCGFQVPGLLAVAPSQGIAPDRWIATGLASLDLESKKRPVLLEPSDGVRRLNLKPLFGKHSPVRPHGAESPFLIPPAADNAPWVAGSCLASYSALADAGIPAAAPDTLPAPDTLAEGILDLCHTAAELRSVNSVLKLAAAFVPGMASLRPALDGAGTVLDTVAALGTLRFRLRAGNPAHLDASFTAPTTTTASSAP